jgi:hypothetical protein
MRPKYSDVLTPTPPESVLARDLRVHVGNAEQPDRVLLADPVEEVIAEDGHRGELHEPLRPARQRRVQGVTGTHNVDAMELLEARTSTLDEAADARDEHGATFAIGHRLASLAFTFTGVTPPPPDCVNSETSSQFRLSRGHARNTVDVSEK